MDKIEVRRDGMGRVGWLGRTLRSDVWIGLEPFYIAAGWFRDSEPDGRWEVIAVDVSLRAASKAGNRVLAGRKVPCEANAIVAVDGVIPEGDGGWMFQGSVGSCAAFDDVSDTLPRVPSGPALPDFDGLRRAVDAHLGDRFRGQLAAIAPHPEYLRTNGRRQSILPTDPDRNGL